LRCAASTDETTVRTEWAQTALLGKASIHQQAGRRTVRQLAGVASSDTPPFDHWFEAGKPCSAGIRAQTFVLGEEKLLVADFLGLFVYQFLLHPQWHDLLVELAIGLGGGGPLMSKQRILILRIAADTVFPGNELGSLDHRHVGLWQHIRQNLILLSDGQL